ncbi:RICIN domain-containing protein [Streptomyces akebiae]|nr:RICIN domain-containing protein [Streptomyces akebiae]
MEPSIYEIKGLVSGKVLEAAGLSRADGGNVVIRGGGQRRQQHWAITPTGDGYYFLNNRYSGLCLAVDEGSTADGATIEHSRTRH